MISTGWGALAEDLRAALHLAAPPIAITFSDEVPEGVSAFDEPMASPASDGRTGRVPAGCVFWIKATDRTFTTVPEDHGNCSVGSLTHGLKSLPDIVGNNDVAELLGCGWVTEVMVQAIPTVRKRHACIIYGPLADTPLDPDVVLLRVNARQMMVLHDAVPSMTIEGKPQCHVVAIAKEQGEVAASVGCALSRARTGMRPEEMTCAIPAPRLAEVVEALERTSTIDEGVAKYAASDSQRFG
jgi:uncharacterized protein (DUF169 family)